MFVVIWRAANLKVQPPLALMFAEDLLMPVSMLAALFWAVDLLMQVRTLAAVFVAVDLLQA